MTADRSLLDAFEQVFGPTDWNRPHTYDLTSDLDEDTLRRMHRQPSPGAMSYRRAADQPHEPWADEIAAAVGDCTEAS